MVQNSPKFSLLLVDDDPRMISSLRRMLPREGLDLSDASSGPEALDVVSQRRIDCAIVDYKMPGMDGLNLLKELRQRHPLVSVIMLTGQGGVPQAVEAIRNGAFDFIEKDDNPESVLACVARAKKIWELEQENIKLKERLKGQGALNAIIGESNAIKQVKHSISQLGATDLNVLVVGESGTGKELAARALHAASERSQKPFIPVDCAAISETLIESELFGHTRGAFTGAFSSTVGLIRSAEGGTLFLDEIGELPLKAQAKLLRVLQERTVRAIGGKDAHPVDIRVVAATNRNLEEEMNSGGFREDLYYRLNVAMIQMPPLRERTTDISLLSNYFLAKHAMPGKVIKGFTKVALDILESYQWPGNVRELENAINRAIVICGGEFIDIHELPNALTGKTNQRLEDLSTPNDASLAEYEKAAIVNAMKLSQGDKAKAASILGIGVSTLYRKLGTYKINISV